MSGDAHDSEKDLARYRLEVAGPVGPAWVDWFGADTMVRRGGNTVLEVRVADQSELYGRLRRIHDLNLRLLAVTFIEPGNPDGESGGTPCGLPTKETSQ